VPGRYRGVLAMLEPVVGVLGGAANA